MHVYIHTTDLLHNLFLPMLPLYQMLRAKEGEEELISFAKEAAPAPIQNQESVP